MSMKAGKLRHELTIESYGGTPDAMGQVIRSWSTFQATYGSIRNLTGDELLVAQQVNGKINSEIKIRWVSGLRTDMRIITSTSGASRTYNIININAVDEIQETYILQCQRLEDNTNG